MAPAREGNAYESGGGFGKVRKRPFRKTQTTPYDRPARALRNPNRNNGWLSKVVDPAQRVLASSNSSVSVTAMSTSTATTTRNPVVEASSSPTTSFFKVGSTSLPLENKRDIFICISHNFIFQSLSVSSSASEQRENKSGIFGFSSPATTGNSQSLGSVFGTTTGSIPASGFAPLSERRSVAFGSSASSPLFSLTGNTAFPSGSSLFPSSSSAMNIFNVVTISGQSTPVLKANPVSSSNGTSSSMFGLSSWQPSKSPFGSSFSSHSSTSSGFSFAASTPSVTSTSFPMMIGQQAAPLQSNFAFGASTPTGASPFQFANQQNIAPQNPSPFQASGSLELNAGGSFSLSTGGGDKAGLKYVKVKPRLTGNTAFPSGSSLFPSSSSATNIFNVVTTSGQSTPALKANPVSSSNGTSSSMFGLSSSSMLASGSLELNAGGGDMAVRKYVMVKQRSRKK